MRPRTVRLEDGQVVRQKMDRRGRGCNCGVKSAYSSKKLAKAAARRQSKMSGENIVAYHCYPGHCYHLGHAP